MQQTFQIHIDVAEIKLIDKGNYFTLSIPTKVYSSANLLTRNSSRSPIKQQSKINKHSLNSKEGSSPTKDNKKLQQNKIKTILKLKNKFKPNQINQQLQSLQKQYLELFRSKLTDQNIQAHKDQIKKIQSQEKKPNMVDKKEQILAGTIDKNKSLSDQQKTKNNIFQNKAPENQNQRINDQHNKSSTSQNNRNISPFTKNTINNYNSTSQNNTSYTNNSSYNNSNSTLKNPFYSSSSTNSLYSSQNNQNNYSNTNSNYNSNNNYSGSSNILPNIFTFNPSSQNSQNNQNNQRGGMSSNIFSTPNNNNNNSSLFAQPNNDNSRNYRSTSRNNKGGSRIA